MSGTSPSGDDGSSRFPHIFFSLATKSLATLNLNLFGWLLVALRVRAVPSQGLKQILGLWSFQTPRILKPGMFQKLTVVEVLHSSLFNIDLCYSCHILFVCISFFPYRLKVFQLVSFMYLAEILSMYTKKMIIIARCSIVSITVTACALRS